VIPKRRRKKMHASYVLLGGKKNRSGTGQGERRTAVPVLHSRRKEEKERSRVFEKRGDAGRSRAKNVKGKARTLSDGGMQRKTGRHLSKKSEERGPSKENEGAKILYPSRKETGIFRA